MKEIWKDIEVGYQISNLGRVKSLRRGKEKIIKNCLDRGGYLVVRINNKTKKVHQLVAIAFLNHTPCGMRMVVNHKDFNRCNNYVNNLEIITQRENCNQKHLSSSSQFVGVGWNKQSKKWRAQITIGSKSIYLGSFNSEEEAYKYYKDALESIENNSKIKTKEVKTSSNYKGVAWNKKDKKWRAYITFDKRQKYLGSFETEEEAHFKVLEYNLTSADR